MRNRSSLFVSPFLPVLLLAACDAEQERIDPYDRVAVGPVVDDSPSNHPVFDPDATLNVQGSSSGEPADAADSLPTSLENAEAGTAPEPTSDEESERMLSAVREVDPLGSHTATDELSAEPPAVEGGDCGGIELSTPASCNWERNSTSAGTQVVVYCDGGKHVMSGACHTNGSAHLLGGFPNVGSPNNGTNDEDSWLDGDGWTCNWDGGPGGGGNLHYVWAMCCLEITPPDCP
jgi:hypothetical protein